MQPTLCVIPQRFDEFAQKLGCRLKMLGVMMKNCLDTVFHGVITKYFIDTMTDGVMTKNGLDTAYHGVTTKNCLDTMSHGVLKKYCLDTMTDGVNFLQGVPLNEYLNVI